jgi:hypothetical protein
MIKMPVRVSATNTHDHHKASRPKVESERLPALSEEKRAMDDIGEAADLQRDQLILNRCATLGLPLLRAIHFAVAADSKDPQSLLRVLDLDFSTFKPMRRRHPKRWLWMAAQTSSVSYRDTLTEADLLSVLTGTEVPSQYLPHVGHFLDEAPIEVIVMATEEAAQRSGLPIHRVWGNIEQLAFRYSDSRQSLWTWKPSAR